MSTAPDYLEILAQVHDLLHKAKVSDAHELLHKAMGVDNDSALPGARISHQFGFDQSFRTACRKNGVSAMYVLIDTVDKDGKARLLSGGDAELCAVVGRAIKGMQ